MFWKKKKEENNNTIASISVISHQLRTPIASIRFALKTLLENKEGNLTKEQIRFISEAEARADDIQELLEHLLSEEKIEDSNKKGVKKEGSIEALLDEVVNQLTLQFDLKHLSLKKQYAPETKPILFNKEKMRMVFENILNNAIMYTPENGEVSITTSYLEGKCRIDIADTGIGVPVEGIPDLFKKYARLKNAVALNPGGSGLGLYIAQNIVNDHDGSITYHRNKEQQSVFSITIPVLV